MGERVGATMDEERAGGYRRAGCVGLEQGTRLERRLRRIPLLRNNCRLGMEEVDW